MLFELWFPVSAGTSNGVSSTACAMLTSPPEGLRLPLEGINFALICAGKRHRFRDGVYDLDLSYVTDRIIAFGLPAEGFESAYRNPLDEVARFLQNRHAEQFMIFNLSQRKYDYSKFDYRVVEMGWPDHYTAPLSVLIELSAAIDSWLAGGTERVACVHCLAGKGRTGVAIASYLVYSGALLSHSSASDGSDLVKSEAIRSIAYRAHHPTAAVDSASDDGGAADDDVEEPEGGNEHDDGASTASASVQDTSMEVPTASTPPTPNNEEDNVIAPVVSAAYALSSLSIAGIPIGHALDLASAVAFASPDAMDAPKAQAAPLPSTLSNSGTAVTVSAASAASAHAEAEAEHSPAVSSAPAVEPDSTSLSPLEAEAASLLSASQAIESVVPPAHEIASRAIQLFVSRRGDGLNFAAQRRSVRYMADLVRTTLVTALVGDEAAVASARAVINRRQHASSIRPSATTEAGATESASATQGAQPSIDYTSALSALHSLHSLPPPPTVCIWTIVFHGVPRLKSSPVLRPSIQLCMQPHQDASHNISYDTLFSVGHPENLPTYRPDDGAIVFNVNAIIAGDVLLRCVHHYQPSGIAGSIGKSLTGGVGTGASAAAGATDGASGGGEWKSKEIFRYSFNTGHLRLNQETSSKIHRVYRNDLDIDRRKKNSRRLPQGFFIDVMYEDRSAAGAVHVSADADGAPTDSDQYGDKLEGSEVSDGAAHVSFTRQTLLGISASLMPGLESAAALDEKITEAVFQVEQSVLASQLLGSEAGFGV